MCSDKARQQRWRKSCYLTVLAMDIWNASSRDDTLCDVLSSYFSFNTELLHRMALNGARAKVASSITNQNKAILARKLKVAVLTAIGMGHTSYVKDFFTHSTT